VVRRTGRSTVDGPAGNGRCGQAANAWRAGRGVRDVLGCVRPGEGTSPRNGAGGARKPRVAGSPRRGTRGRAWPARRRGTASFLAQTF
jgi:hypothetical protein